MVERKGGSSLQCGIYAHLSTIGLRAYKKTVMEWKISPEPVEYDDALAFMDARVAAIHAGEAGDLAWLLEHPSLYTAGTSADEADLLNNGGLPVHKTGRGGQYTYHGPGQRIAYVMMDLKTRGGAPDVKRYVCDLEGWIIRTLKEFGIEGHRRDGQVGIWVDGPRGPEKIAAIGVRVRHWITLHGISINIDPELSHYKGIVPCGISDMGVTSMKALGVEISAQDVDAALRKSWADIFGDQSAARSTSWAEI